ncbi:MAG: sigma-70 family RNA polymerase sigma factor [Gemmataceae bacterium]|nr:sigma-70 family RNA polymerase sigma factor [Gemmataceae bacterium]
MEDQKLAEELFRRYSDRLIALARTRLSDKVNARIDPEDVVQSAYRSFFAGARNGRYALEVGGDVWLLLVAITVHKLQDQVRKHTAGKRSVNREQNFSSEDSLLGLQAEGLAREPSPVEALSLVEEVEQLMRALTPLERQMVELRLQGGNLRDIAAATNRSVPTVRRLLDRIKDQLRQQHGDSVGPPGARRRNS